MFQLIYCRRVIFLCFPFFHSITNLAFWLLFARFSFLFFSFCRFQRVPQKDNSEVEMSKNNRSHDNEEEITSSRNKQKEIEHHTKDISTDKKNTSSSQFDKLMKEEILKVSFTFRFLFFSFFICFFVVFICYFCCLYIHCLEQETSRRNHKT
jgi:ATP-dependent Zn protease